MKLFSHSAYAPESNESGMTTASYVIATGFSLIVLTWCTVFIVMSYSRAVIRASADRASRAGVVSFTSHRDSNIAEQACRDKFEQDIAQALPANVRSDISSQCSVSNGKVVVTTTGTLKNISIAIPNFTLNERTTRDVETLP